MEVVMVEAMEVAMGEAMEDMGVVDNVVVVPILK